MSGGENGGEKRGCMGRGRKGDRRVGVGERDKKDKEGKNFNLAEFSPQTRFSAADSRAEIRTIVEWMEGGVS